jgi:eukaryotic-like serine/threonine-protein kinase
MVPSQARQAKLQSGAWIAKRYQIIQALGVDEGEVYEVLGVDHQRGWMKLWRGSRIQERFQILNEAKFDQNQPWASQLMPIQEVGLDLEQNVVFIVFPWFRGNSLSSLLRHTRELPQSVAIQLTIQIANGVHSMHASGGVHGQLRPSQIFLIQGADDTIQVKVGYLGRTQSLVSAATTHAVSKEWHQIATYLAPEMLLSNAPPHERCDVWGVAMCLYEMLSGVSALGSTSNFSELMLGLTRGTWLSVQEHAPWVSGDVVRIVHSGLVVEPALRCPNLHLFVQALQPLVADKGAVRVEELCAVPDAERRLVAPVVALPERWESTTDKVENEEPTSLSHWNTWVGMWIDQKYQILRCIGSGGMGAVFDVQSRDGMRFAMKILHTELVEKKPELIRRFLREAQSCISIVNPHVVRVFDVGTDQQTNTPYLVMELMQGKDLGYWIAEHGALEERSALKIFLQITRGLSAAHSLGIVHRDIKPPNLFLSVDAEDRVLVKICDFGVAKQLTIGTSDHASTNLTRSGGLLGSPWYMSPEQIQNAKHVDHRCDIWSVGISFYETLSGKNPWQNLKTIGQVLVAICTQMVPPLRSIAPWVSQELSEVIHRCLQKEPSARIQDVNLLYHELRRLAPDEIDLRIPQLRDGKSKPAHVYAESSTVIDESSKAELWPVAKDKV